MRYISSLWKVSLIGLIVFGCGRSTNSAKEDVSAEVKETETPLKVDTFPILTEHKLELTKQYSEINYGTASYELDSIKMIVVHFTVIPTLHQTLDLFSKDSLHSNRKYIKNFSALNVGIHYVVDRDGRIYHLMPDSVMARHIIGFNHLSLGIENIARDASDLTAQQLASNAVLIHFLKQRYPEMEYLIGHDEYNQTDLPHYQLFKSLDPDYQPYDKPDPGPAFMKDLRQLLKSQYELEFME
mgnify:CR=1 FL=1